MWQYVCACCSVRAMAGAQHQEEACTNLHSYKCPSLYLLLQSMAKRLAFKEDELLVLNE